MVNTWARTPILLQFSTITKAFLPQSFLRFLPTHSLETLGVVGVSICNFLTVSIRIFWGLGYNPPNSYYCLLDSPSIQAKIRWCGRVLPPPAVSSLEVPYFPFRMAAPGAHEGHQPRPGGSITGRMRGHDHGQRTVSCRTDAGSRGGSSDKPRRERGYNITVQTCSTPETVTVEICTLRLGDKP
eukprot:SAG22_NODE_334_length_12094_cov_9.446019_2_plen_184_part_00